MEEKRIQRTKIFGELLFLKDQKILASLPHSDPSVFNEGNRP